MTTTDIKYLYLQDPSDPKRTITVARRLVKTDKGNKMQVGLSVNRTHSYPMKFYPSDTFNKERGRMIAAARLEAARNHYYEVSIDDTIDVPAVVQMLEQLIKEVEMMRGFKRCARHKLQTMHKRFEAALTGNVDSRVTGVLHV